MVVRIMKQNGLWKVLLEGREEATCRTRGDALELGMDIAERTNSDCVADGEDFTGRDVRAKQLLKSRGAEGQHPDNVGELAPSAPTVYAGLGRIWDRVANKR